MVVRRSRVTVADGRVDCTSIIQSAIDLLYSNGGGTLYLSGTYTVSLTSGARCLSLPDGVHIRQRPAAAQAVLRLANSQAASTRILRVTGTSTISGIEFDGNRANQTANEHRHGIFVDGGTATVEDCDIHDFTGDGVYFYVGGSGTVTNSEIHHNDRNGVTFGGPNDGPTITDNWFHDIAVQHIDSEPTAPNAVSNVLLARNTFDRGDTTDFLVAMGSSTLYPSVGWTIEDNQFNGGCLRIIWSSDSVVRGNTWTMSDPAYPKWCVQVYNRSTETLIEGNVFTSAVEAVRITATGADQQPEGVILRDNTFTMTAAVDACDGSGAKSVTFSDNDVTWTGDGGHGFDHRFTVRGDSMTVTGNTFDGASKAVRLTSAATDICDAATVTGNSFIDCVATIDIEPGSVTSATTTPNTTFP